MAVTKLNTQSFDSMVNSSDKIVFVDFNAVWCGPCKMYGPIFEQFSELHADEVECGSVDVDESGEIAMRYGINAVPTTIIFKNGQPVSQMLGATDLRGLEGKLASVK